MLLSVHCHINKILYQVRKAFVRLRFGRVQECEASYRCACVHLWSFSVYVGWMVCVCVCLLLYPQKKEKQLTPIAESKLLRLVVATVVVTLHLVRSHLKRVQLYIYLPIPQPHL